MNYRYLRIAFYLIALVTLSDQISKWWLVNEVMQPPHTVAVNSFFNLVLVQNRGVTFGLMNRLNPQWAPYVLLAIAVLILVLLGRWLWRTSSALVATALGLIMGGAIGNVIDRARFGAVVDFLDFHINNYHWYSFNLADSAIVIGVTLLLLDGLIRGR